MSPRSRATPRISTGVSPDFAERRSNRLKEKIKKLMDSTQKESSRAKKMKSISSNVSVSRFGGTGRERNPNEKHVEIMISPQDESDDEYRLSHHPMTEKFKVMNSEIAQMFIR